MAKARPNIGGRRYLGDCGCYQSKSDNILHQCRDHHNPEGGAAALYADQFEGTYPGVPHQIGKGFVVTMGIVGE